MANTNFSSALKEILKHEGGFVNHPADPGGITNLGVTKRAYEAYVGRTVSEAEMKKLTPTVVAPFYKTQYWDRVRGDELPAGIDLCVFDFGVNAGPGRAIKLLQRLIGVADDGVIGPMTVNATRAFAERHGVDYVITQYQQLRRNYYKSLSTFKVFGKGWLRRVDEVEKTALRR